MTPSNNLKHPHALTHMQKYNYTVIPVIHNTTPKNVKRRKSEEIIPPKVGENNSVTYDKLDEIDDILLSEIS